MRWQARDRYYEQVQRAAQGLLDVSEDALKIMNGLQDLMGPLPEDVQVWRGVRSVKKTFHADVGHLRAGSSTIARRFMSTSITPYVVRDEFTQPGDDAAMLNITARAGTAAVWVPPIGDPQMAYQGELLFRPGAMLRILAVDAAGEIPVIEVEVSRP